MPFFCTGNQGRGVKSFFGRKMTKVMTFFGGEGGVGGNLFFIFLKIHSIYDIFLIGSFNKSFLETFRK